MVKPTTQCSCKVKIKDVLGRDSYNEEETEFEKNAKREDLTDLENEDLAQQ